MANEQAMNPAENPAEEVEADGYYGDDDMSDEELDLSFLDDEEADDDGTKDTKDTAESPASK